MVNTDNYEDEPIILLAESHSSDKLFFRVRSMFSKGFCCPTSMNTKQTILEAEEQTDDTQTTTDDEENTSGAPSMMENVFPRAPMDHLIPQSVTISTEQCTSLKETTTCKDDDDVRVDNTLSFSKKVLTSLFALYILIALVHYHFNFDLLDLFLYYFFKLREVMYPYASTIITTQLLTPLLFFIIKESTHQRETPESSIEGTDSDDEDDALSRPQNQSDLVFETEENSVDEMDLDLDEATRNLPDVSKWKYRPVFIQPAGGTRCPGHNPNESLPIGVPFEFESSLFKGRALFRLRNGKSNEDPDESKAYFDAHDHFNFQRQFVIQGQFKHRTKMSEVWVGDIFDKKFKLAPPPRLGKFMSNLFTRMAPGIMIDFASSRPKVLALIGAGSHSMSIDKPGEEPDITIPILPEKTFLSHDEKSSQERKHALGNPKTASYYEFDPELVYTFHTADGVLDLAEYKLRLPILTMDFTRVLGDGQPMSLRAVVGDSSDSFFFFRVWHERTLVKARKRRCK